METSYKKVINALSALIHDEYIPLDVRINALKSLDILILGRLSDIYYDANHVKWFAKYGEAEYNISQTNNYGGENELLSSNSN